MLAGSIIATYVTSGSMRRSIAKPAATTSSPPTALARKPRRLTSTGAA